MIMLSIFRIIFILFNLLFHLTESSSGSHVYVSLDPNLSESSARSTITNTILLLNFTSQTLRTATRSLDCFNKVTILVPQHWSKTYYTPFNTKVKKSSISFKNADIFIHSKPTPFDDKAYTIQYGSCGSSGKSIHLSASILNEINIKSSKLLTNHWVRYKYGVFHEHGFIHDPLYPAFTSLNSQQIKQLNINNNIKLSKTLEQNKNKNNYNSIINNYPFSSYSGSINSNVYDGLRSTKSSIYQLNHPNYKRMTTYASSSASLSLKKPSLINTCFGNNNTSFSLIGINSEDCFIGYLNGDVSKCWSSESNTNVDKLAGILGTGWSLMANTEMQQYCDNDGHDSFTTTKHNILCGGDSIMSVIRRKVRSPVENCRTSFEIGINEIDGPHLSVLLDATSEFETSINLHKLTTENLLTDRKFKNSKVSFYENIVSGEPKPLRKSQMFTGKEASIAVDLMKGISKLLNDYEDYFNIDGDIIPSTRNSYWLYNNNNNNNINHDSDHSNFALPHHENSFKLILFTEGLISSSDELIKETARRCVKASIIPKIILFPYDITQDYEKLLLFAKYTSAEVIPIKNGTDSLFELLYTLHFKFECETILLKKELTTLTDDNEFTFNVDTSLIESNADIEILIVGPEQQTNKYNLRLDGHNYGASKYFFPFPVNVSRLVLESKFLPGNWTLSAQGSSRKPLIVAAYAFTKSNISSTIHGECWMNLKGSVIHVKDGLTVYVSLMRGPLEFVQVVDVKLKVIYEDKKKEYYMVDDGLGSPDLTKGDGIWSFEVKELDHQQFVRFEAEVHSSQFKLLEPKYPVPLSGPCCGSSIPSPSVYQNYHFISRTIDCGYIYVTNPFIWSSKISKVNNLKVNYEGSRVITVEFTPPKGQDLKQELRIFEEKDKNLAKTFTGGVISECCPISNGKITIPLPEDFNQTGTYYARLKIYNDKTSVLSNIVNFWIDFETENTFEDNENEIHGSQSSTSFGLWQLVGIVAGSFLFISLLLLFIICFVAEKQRKWSKNEKINKLENFSSLDATFAIQSIKPKGYDNKAATCDQNNGINGVNSETKPPAKLTGNMEHTGLNGLSPVDSFPVDKLLDHYGKVVKAKERREPPPVMRVEDITDKSDGSVSSRFRGSFDDTFGADVNWRYLDQENEAHLPQYTYQPYYMPHSGNNISWTEGSTPSDYDPRYGIIENKITAVSQV